jgi:serine/threonine protein kinase
LNWESAIDKLQTTNDADLRKRLVAFLHEKVRIGRIQANEFAEKISKLYRETSDPWLSIELKRLQNRLRTRKILGRDLLRLREPPLGDDEKRRLWEDVKALQEAHDRAQDKGQGLEVLYDVREQIGEGGMSVVFRAVRKADHVDVAIKYLRKQLLNNPATAARFRRECRLCTSFDHPNIIRVFDSGEHNGSAFLVMEYLPLGGLDGFIDHPDLSPRHSLAAIRQAAGALAYIHEKGVIHRDVKLSNLLVAKWRPGGAANIDNQIQVRLSDFGLCKEISADGFTRADTKMGTDFYSAPEMLYKPSRADHRADIYSLGVSLYRLLSGGAFPEKEYAPLQKQSSQIPAGIDEIVRGCVEEDREKRCSSASQVAAMLSEIFQNKEDVCSVAIAKPK